MTKTNLLGIYYVLSYNQPMGKINLLVANANQNFTDIELSVFQSATIKAENFIASNFDFDYEVDLIIATPSFLLQTIPEDGISGRTYHSRMIIVVVDKEQRPINEDIVFETICHEMSHSLRWEKLPEYSKTMFDGMILEGLAIALEEKAMKVSERDDSQFFLKEMKHVTQNEINQMITTLSPYFGDEQYYYDTVFYIGNDTLPRWAGYKLGYCFVKRYLEKTGETIEQATLASYSKFSLEI